MVSEDEEEEEEDEDGWVEWAREVKERFQKTVGGGKRRGLVVVVVVVVVWCYVWC